MKQHAHTYMCLSVVSSLQAIERKTNPCDASDTQSAFTFLDDTEGSSDHHGWEVGARVQKQYAVKPKCMLTSPVHYSSSCFAHSAV